ncbi:YDR131Cp-like protein, partial [Saccharomyces cerevisiae AWRI1631]
MFDKLPYEIFKQIAWRIPQEDKISLTYVCKRSYESIIPFIYQNLFLNETYHINGDYDNSFGTCYWSVLNFHYIDEDDSNTKNDMSNRRLAKVKFSYFERTLAESPKRLCPLINRIRCTWHLNEDVMTNVLKLLSEYGSNLKFVDQFVRSSVNKGLEPLSKQLKTLTLTPPTLMPTHNSVSGSYLNKIDRLLLKCDLSRLEKLSIHINALKYFKNTGSPMKIKALVLNLRPDTL